MEEASPQEKITWIIIFTLLGENWGIKFEEVQELIEQKEITPVPKTPPFILGITHKRGKIITVIDFALLIGKAPEKVKGSKIIVLKSDKLSIGLRVTSKISTEILPEELASNGVVFKENRGEENLILGQKIVSKDKTKINLLECGRIIEFLEHYPFNY